MKAAYRYLGFIFLSAALTAPMTIQTSAATQDDHRDEKKKLASMIVRTRITTTGTTTKTAPTVSILASSTRIIVSIRS